MNSHANLRTDPTCDP